MLTKKSSRGVVKQLKKTSSYFRPLTMQLFEIVVMARVKTNKCEGKCAAKGVSRVFSSHLLEA